MKNYYQLLTDFIELYKAAPKEVVADLDKLFPKEMNMLFMDLLQSEGQIPREEVVDIDAVNKLIESEQ